MLKQLKNGKKVVGLKQLKKALRDETALAVFLAKDGDPKMVEPMEATCQEAGVEVIWVDTMTALGQACSIDVGASCAALVK